jgi:hypothetical protein
MFGHLAPPSDVTVDVAASDWFVVPGAVPRSAAERVALADVYEGYLRPPDIHTSEQAPIVLAHVPIWRVDVSVEGFHVGLSRDQPRGSLLPTGGVRHRDEIVLVLARRLLPFDPTARLEIAPRELVPRQRGRAVEGELIAPDVSRPEAEREASDRLRQKVEPSQALYSKFDAHVRAAQLVHYPLWVLRYRYSGEARKDAAPEECHVAVSARTGKIVSAHHPSALRSVAEKVKGWFK